MAITVKRVCDWMEELAPLRLSADWDNTGLLLGDMRREVKRIMTCLTLTPESVEEAVAGGADLVISHHPLPFRPLKKITASEPTGRMLWELAGAGVSVYCPHTAWDSAAVGINMRLAQVLQLVEVVPLIAEKVSQHVVDGETGFAVALPGKNLGTGRVGDLAREFTLADLAKLLCRSVPYCRPRVVDTGNSIVRVGIVCGSGASLIEAAVRNDCDLFLTGEATFHQCLEAKAAGLSMLMIGHFASEKFAMDELASLCKAEFANLEVWGSINEQDPVSSI
ncbi:MAG: Nif3-like dinuclear metal center hexameric protein [Pirellulaceae bacterium]|nr:Nif3-like dinuclear metal center hexameric protein [Pirellulaceae bacterium]